MIASNDVVLRAIQTRAQIMGLQNRALTLGPDFGGAINEPKYLPAYWRYSGRTYQASRDDWNSFRSLPDSVRASILIMSGLYGLVPFDEFIQNYDCHITDTDVKMGQTVVTYWGATMTDILLSHCDRLEAAGTKVGPIVDLLSEKSYQLAIDWPRVYARYSVLHRVFQNKIDRDALVNIGIFLRTLLRDPTRAAS